MKVLRFINILLASLLVLILAGCAAEEGDLTPPDAAVDAGVIVSPTKETTVVFTGTMASDALITADALPAIAVITARDNVAGTWECTVSGMTPGSNTIWVYATDPVANTRTMLITIEVDTVGPIMTILQYPEVAQAGSFSFAGTVDEAGSTVSVEVYDLSDPPVLVASWPAFVDANIWDVNLTLSDGDYNVIATGTDRLGNDSVVPEEQTINIDSTSPVLTINPLLPALSLPVVLNTDEDLQTFDGTAPAGSLLSVSPSSSLTQPIAGVWDATVSGITAANTIVTFDVDNGSTIQKVLVVRDQTAPTVVEWTSTTPSTVTVEFNESMDATTILPENLLIEDSNDTLFSVLSVVQDNDRTFTFTTTASLPLGESYTATLQTPQLPTVCSVVDGCTVEDGRGNGLAASYIWRFNK